MTEDYSEFIQLFRGAFRGREDVVPRHWFSKKTQKSGYAPICLNDWKEGVCKKPCSSCPNPAYVPLNDDLLQQHFGGKHILGVYPLFDDNTCYLVAADFDNHNGGRDPLKDVTEFAAVCEVQEIPCYVERSKSGRGFHAWVFFTTAVAAWKARLVCFAMLKEAGIIGVEANISSFDRLFPNQDAHSGRGLGNLIALPFQGKAAKQGHTLFLDPETKFEKAFSSQIAVLREIKRAGEVDLDRIIEVWGLDRTPEIGRLRLNPGNRSTTGAGIDPATVLAGVAEGSRDETLFRYACSLRARGLDIAEARGLVLVAAQNCKPPFPVEDALAKVEAAWKYEGKDSDSRPKFTRKELADRIEGATDFDELTGPIAREVAESGLPDSHIHSLRKFIAKRSNELNNGAGVSVASLVSDAKDFQKVAADKNLMHLQAAREVAKSYGDGNLIESAGFTWKWDGTGVWRKADNRELKAKIHQVAESEELTRGIVDSIHDMIRTEAFKPDHRFDVNRHTINAQNGELEWTGKCWLLTPHCREHYRTTQLPVAFNPDAKAPRFLQALEEFFRDDEDRVDKTNLIHEAMGYSLLSSCEYEKFFLLIGPGANGKSVLMHTLGALVGREHVAAVQPSQFENRFQRAHLHCKLVNLVTEIAEGHEIADAQLKAIVSGELTTAEHKHKDPFDFIPFATCWFGTNHMPHTRDFSNALFRRAIILTFNRTFAEEEQDEHLKDKLVQELPGILNLALVGMANVFRRGGFTKAESCEKAKLEWRLNSDQVAQFVEDRCNIGPGLLEISANLYLRYEEWAKENGIKRSLNRNNFTSRLRRLGAEPTKGTGGVRMMAGIELR